MKIAEASKSGETVDVGTIMDALGIDAVTGESKAPVLHDIPDIKTHDPRKLKDAMGLGTALPLTLMPRRFRNDRI